MKLLPSLLTAEWFTTEKASALHAIFDLALASSQHDKTSIKTLEKLVKLCEQKVNSSGEGPPDYYDGQSFMSLAPGLVDLVALGGKRSSGGRMSGDSQSQSSQSSQSHPRMSSSQDSVGGSTSMSRPGAAVIKTQGIRKGSTTTKAVKATTKKSNKNEDSDSDSSDNDENDDTVDNEISSSSEEEMDEEEKPKATKTAKAPAAASKSRRKAAV